MFGDLGWNCFVYFGCLRDPKWFPNSCDETPVFSKTICGNAKLDAFFLLVLGSSGAFLVPFWHHFGGSWGPNGVLFRDFGGLVASLGALGAQFAPGPPGSFHAPRPFLAILAPKRSPRDLKMEEQISPKIDAKIYAIFD